MLFKILIILLIFWLLFGFGGGVQENFTYITDDEDLTVEEIKKNMFVGWGEPKYDLRGRLLNIRSPRESYMLPQRHFKVHPSGRLLYYNQIAPPNYYSQILCPDNQTETRGTDKCYMLSRYVN